MPSDTSHSRSELLIISALFLVSLFAYALLCRLFPVTTYDGRVYLELAKNIPHSGYVFLDRPYAKFLPLYPGLMALLDRGTGFSLPTETWGYLINVIAGALIPPLIFIISRGLKASRISSLFVASLQVALAVGLDQYRDVNIMPLFNLLLALVLFFLLRERFFWAGIVCGLATAVRHEIYLLIPFMALANLKKPRAIIAAVLGLCAHRGSLVGL